tara:strand:- start:1290 stop:1802 length:513 start_codon:yes stop_codon:yes gene_type:complete
MRGRFNRLTGHANTLFQPFSNMAQRQFLTKADLKRHDDHFEYFYDLRHTVTPDKIIIARNYDLTEKPDGFALLKDTLPQMYMPHSLTLVLESFELIKNSKDAIEVFDLLFDKIQYDQDIGARLAFAKIIKPKLTNQYAIDTIASRLNEDDKDLFLNACANQETKQTFKHT